MSTFIALSLCEHLLHMCSMSTVFSVCDLQLVLHILVYICDFHAKVTFRKEVVSFGTKGIREKKDDKQIV